MCIEDKLTATAIDYHDQETLAFTPSLSLATVWTTGGNWPLVRTGHFGTAHSTSLKHTMLDRDREQGSHLYNNKKKRGRPRG